MIASHTSSPVLCRPDSDVSLVLGGFSKPALNISRTSQRETVVSATHTFVSPRFRRKPKQLNLRPEVNSARTEPGARLAAGVVGGAAPKEKGIVGGGWPSRSLVCLSRLQVADDSLLLAG